MAEERLQKIIARAGLASRREAEDLIREGKVTVNGKVAELGQKADLSRDHVKVRGKLITSVEEKRYILLNKPDAVVATASDPEERTTVIDLLKGVSERVFPVGRLDYHSEGLLILTNDGELANRLSHPRYGCEKIYHVKVHGAPDDAALQKLRSGIRLEDGTRTRPCEIERLRQTKKKADSNSWLEVRLSEGKNQQIRRMFDQIGHRVMRLRRIAIGPVEDENLPRGQWRDLSDFEVRALKSSSTSGRTSSSKSSRAGGGAKGRKRSAPKKPGSKKEKKR